MRPGSRRALLGLSFVLLPAAGIAYLGAVSYQEDRGIVAAKLDELFNGAELVAAQVEEEVDRTLDAVAERFQRAEPVDEEGLAELVRSYPLAARPFLIGRDGGLRYPAAAPLRAPRAASRDGDRFARDAGTCPQRGFDSCVQTIRAARRREAQLLEARRREIGTCSARGCKPTERGLAEARRTYTALARYDDSAPEALVGLARLMRRAGKNEQARQEYAALGRRFPDRSDSEGVPFGLIADLGSAEVEGDPSGFLALYRKLLGRRYAAPAAVLANVAARLRSRLAAADLTASQRAELAALDARLSAARREAAFAAALAPEVDDIARSAEKQASGRPARALAKTVVYRREADGSVVGLVIDRKMLEAVAERVDADVRRLAVGVRIVVNRMGHRASDQPAIRVLATTGFGPVLPHLTLALVNDRSLPDPLDEIVRIRGRRHLAITGGLMVLLLVGLFATIRGAARERELARQKSEFVATVSHELKTPLTSIRMFAEMLQQQVAAGDHEREQHYHGIIVKESERLGHLIANLLDYAQIERGTRRYSQQRVGAASVLEEAVATFQRLHEHAPPEIRSQIDDDVAGAEILVDREVVIQALLNLLANAVKYGGEDQPIEVQLTGRGDRVVLAVRDRGPGIPPGEQERIFRQFYRAPGAYKSSVEGTGLGLALVKRHVEAQGGAVELDSAVGVGSTFSLVFDRIV